jgi:cytidine deaminase
MVQGFYFYKMSAENNFDELIAKAKAASEKAYAPYSKLHVGAVVVTEKGNTYSGCNMENASFGLTTCAERNAIAGAVAAEVSAMKIKMIAVVVQNDRPAAPCGACRQVIAQFANPKTTRVIYKSPAGEVVSKKISEILPDAFTF